MDQLAEIAVRWEAEDAAKRTRRAVEPQAPEKAAELLAAE